jgi:NifU-like protein
MSFYPPKIAARFRKPKNAGELPAPTASGSAGATECGAIARLTLCIDPADHIIHEAKFKSSGCGFAVAAMSLLTDCLIGITVPEAANLLQRNALWNSMLAEQLGEFPHERKHCATLALEALTAALRDHRATFPDHAPGEEALICTCFFVSEKTIETAIRQHDLQSVDDVTRKCRAGGGCGSCQPLIAELIDLAQRQTLELNHDLFGQ